MCAQIAYLVHEYERRPLCFRAAHVGGAKHRFVSSGRTSTNLPDYSNTVTYIALRNARTYL